MAVVGDVAGHVDELRAELTRLGADPVTGRLPADLTVVQVGDLVHRGPDSAAVVRLVDSYLASAPGQWVQLVGNHEAQYLGEPLFDWPERLPEEAVATVRRWWADGQLRAAVALAGDGEDFLVTHAGLTSGFWRDLLGAPEDAGRAAATLNALVARHVGLLLRPGQMLAGGRPSRGAGPVWAAAATEVVPSWLGRDLPFSQLHGHTSVYDWQHRRFRAPAEVARRTRVDEQAKHAEVLLSGGRIIGVDPGHGLRPRQPWRAWVLPAPRPAAP